MSLKGSEMSMQMLGITVYIMENQKWLCYWWEMLQKICCLIWCLEPKFVKNI